MTAVSTKTASPRKLIEGSRTISRPGSAVVVKELLLTPEGRAAITSGSRGIYQGAREHAGPPRTRPEDPVPA